MRPSSPSPQRYSTVMLRPSTKSDSAKPRRKPASSRTYAPGEAMWRNPITGMAGCCARAASGQTTAEPAITLMNSRRLIRVLAQARDHATRLQNDTLHKGLGVGLNDIQKAVIGTLPDVRYGSKAEMLITS